MFNGALRFDLFNPFCLVIDESLNLCLDQTSHFHVPFSIQELVTNLYTSLLYEYNFRSKYPKQHHDGA